MKQISHAFSLKIALQKLSGIDRYLKTCQVYSLLLIIKYYFLLCIAKKFVQNLPLKQTLLQLCTIPKKMESFSKPYWLCIDFPGWYNNSKHICDEIKSCPQNRYFSNTSFLCVKWSTISFWSVHKLGSTLNKKKTMSFRLVS